jgi:hypothetical protein
MSNPAMRSRLASDALLRWCGYAALVGLFVGTAIGAVAITR